MRWNALLPGFERLIHGPVRFTVYSRVRRKRQIYGGMLGFIGFMLSPLSWWNDLFVNFPIALAFAWLASLVYSPLFTASFVAGYWATNVIGLILMQRGAKLVATGESKPYTKRSLMIDFGISIIYTSLILVLIHYGIVKPITDPHSST